MPTFSSSFTLRFIRNTESTAASTDDLVKIRKNLEENEFEFTYLDENSGSPVVHEMAFAKRSDLMNHVYLLLKNQMVDDDGFQAVQFTLPAMPRMLVYVDKFRDVYYREHFLDLIENALDCLDRLTVSSSKSNAKKSTKSRRDEAWLAADIATAQAKEAESKAMAARFNSVAASLQEAQRDAPYYYDITPSNATQATTPPPVRRSQRLGSRHQVAHGDPFEV
jgi:hypothetical protein